MLNCTSELIDRFSEGDLIADYEGEFNFAGLLTFIEKLTKLSFIKTNDSQNVQFPPAPLHSSIVNNDGAIIELDEKSFYTV